MAYPTYDVGEIYPFSSCITERIVCAVQTESSTQEVHVSMKAYHRDPEVYPCDGYSFTPKWYWYMELQRFNTYTREWATIGTRGGYVSTNSPSYRTFTNIRKSQDPLRVVIKITGGVTNDDTEYLGNVYLI